MYTTDQYEGMVAETVVLAGDGGDMIRAYLARPLGPGPFPAVLLFHHMPGWDEWYKEATRKFAYHGYIAICPDLYCRDATGPPEEVGAKVRAQGGAPDNRVVGDTEGTIRYLRALPNNNGKVGVFGTCSGGRQAFLTACRSEEPIDAAAELWGGGVVMKPEDLSPVRPVSPIDYTPQLQCPLLGLFGNDDQNPTAEQVDIHEEALKRHGKQYEFHRYEGAGHGFFYHDRPANYRAAAAIDGWKKVFAFFGTHLGGSGD